MKILWVTVFLGLFSNFYSSVGAFGPSDDPFIADLQQNNNVQELSGQDAYPRKQPNEWCHCFHEGSKLIYQIKVWRNEDDPVKVLQVTTACDETMDRYFCHVQGLPLQLGIDEDDDNDGDDDDDDFNLINSNPPAGPYMHAMVDWLVQQISQ